MPAFVLTDAEVVVNSVDLSDGVQAVTVNYSAELQDDTAMGDDTRTMLPGLKTWTMEIQFKQDFDAGKVDATNFSLVGAAEFPITVMSDKTAGVSATNPRFTGNALLETYPILGNTVGELATTSLTYQGTGILTRAIV